MNSDATKIAIEAKRPLTRAVLDSRIEAVQNELDDAVRRKEFAECGPLQDKLEELTSKREELPTISELRELVRNAEGAVALAAKNRDFAGAAKAQVRIDEARQRLADTLAAGDEDESESPADTNGGVYGFQSRAELEAAILEATKEIKDAIHGKDFSKASSLQVLLEEREALRPLFPSVVELAAELKQAKEKLDEAVTRKDFAKAGSLDVVVAELEKKLAAEKENSSGASESSTPSRVAGIVMHGEEKTFETRAALEKEIASASSQVSRAVSGKEFKKADALQADVDKMVQLREALPSIPELRENIRTKKKEMDEAILAKKFSNADELNVAIEALQKVLDTELSLAPQEIVPQARANNATKAPKVIASPTTVKRSNGPGAPIAVTTKPMVLTPMKGAPATVVMKQMTPTPFKGPSSVGSTGGRSATPVKPVSKLRPARPITASTGDTVLSVAQGLAAKRATASILLNGDGSLAGILTDTDITRRVVSKHVDPSVASVSEVMTAGPTCVKATDCAMDALMTMIENKFRHLPVVDGDGSVVGVLDIARCLNDAISKLERSSEKSSSATEDALKQVVSQQAGNGAQAAAMQALLGTLMSQAFGNQATPTLRKLLTGKASTVVRPDTSIREAAMLMAEHRSAALVVDEGGQLTGIFAFKDMMTRAVAKELPLDSTPVSAVMTPEPEAVSPDTTALEALQTMHDNKFLTLPVCEDDGRVLGVVNVMDVIHGCGGAESWKTMFSSAMEVDDDMSDDSSFHSSVHRPKSVVGRSDRSVHTLEKVLEKVEEQRPVSKLRPSKPIISHSDDTIVAVTQLLAKKRGSATLVVSTEGGLAGILTDTDITRRVVAKNVQPDATPVSTVMTPHPTCVKTSDSAMDALMTMIENKFRHLPVVDDDGAVVGLLDIAKCLNDAISKLERSSKKESTVTEDALKQVVSQQGATGAQAAVLQTLLGTLMSQTLGNKASPTLRTLLEGKASTAVGPDTTIREAAMLMAEHRNAAMVVDEVGKLIGIFTFKDMMSRVVAKQLPVDATSVSAVMTASPEAVSPNCTALEALQTMHDNKFLTLPVCEDDGRVVGVVNVMDVIHGCGGVDGWRSMFSTALEVDDDGSSVASMLSFERSIYTPSVRSGRTKPKDDKPVSRLRPAKPLLSYSDETIVAVTQLLAKKRGSATLVVSTEGGLAGILTDTDITRRVVAKYVDPATSHVSEVMTPDPTCVATSDSAMDALMTMIERRFRHLPVVDDVGSVVGLLDIAKCLNDAITKLECSTEKSSNVAEDAVMQAVSQQGATGAQAAAMQALLGNLMSQAFGNKASPTLRNMLAGKPNTFVRPDATIREAAMLMTERRNAAIVVDDDGQLVGIFTFKDMMTRAVAREALLDSTPVSAVMTPEPEAVSPDTTALEALQIMHDNKFLTLPVCEDDGRVIGVVGVMDVIHGCGGVEGWRAIFSSAMEMEDTSDAVSTARSKFSVHSRKKDPVVRVMPTTPFAYPGNNIPATLEFEDRMDGSVNGSTIDDRGASRILNLEDTSASLISTSVAIFKVSDQSGNTHRVRCATRVDELFAAVSEKVGLPSASIQLQYVDDEGDTVIITSDDDAAEAWTMAKRSGAKIAKLNCVTITPKSVVNQNIVMGGAGALVAVIAAAAVVLLRPSGRKS